MTSQHKDIWVALVVVALIAIGSLFVSIKPFAPLGSSGVTSCNGGNCTNFNAVSTSAGYWAGATQIFNGSGNIVIATSTQTTNYYSIGGIDYASVQVSFTATSSVPAVIANPFGAATTSVDSAIVQITSGISGTNTFDLSTTTASSGYGSSTPAFIYAHSVGANTQATFFWGPISSSTPLGGQVLAINSSGDGTSPFFLGPNVALTLRIATGTPATLSSYYSGTLSATFHKP